MKSIAILSLVCILMACKEKDKTPDVPPAVAAESAVIQGESVPAQLQPEPKPEVKAAAPAPAAEPVKAPACDCACDKKSKKSKK